MPRSLLVCHLNSSEVKQFQEHGIRPNCDHHAHIKLNDAQERCGKEVGYGSARWVDDQYRYITDIQPKVWAIVMPRSLPRTAGQPPAGCAGISSMQMVAG